MKRTKIEMPVGQPGRQRSKAKKAKAPLSARLRRRAEERLRRQRRAGKPGAGRQRAGAGIERVVHELRVHQIELEMQNEELRRAQRDLEDSREKYLDLYDLAPVGYLTLNEPGLILEANLTAARLLGVVRKDLVRQPLTRFILREHLDIFYQHRQQLFETGAPQSCELRLTRPGGAPFWVRGQAILAQDHKTGAPVCRMTLSDFTQRKQAEADRDRLAQLMKCAYDSILLADEPGRIIEANDRALETYGYSLAELRQKTLEDLRTPESRAELPRQMEQLETDGRAVFEAMHQRRNGSAFPVEISARFLEIAGVRYRLSIVRDITERKQAEAALQESKERYHSLFSSSLDAVLLTVPDGRILAANETACHMFGFSEEELTQVGRSAIVDASDPRLSAGLAERLRSGRFIGELTLVRRNGSKFPGEISSAVFRNQTGELRSSMVIRDITERKRAQERLRTSEERLRLGLNTAKVSVFAQDLDLRYTWMHQPQLGYTFEQVQGHTDADLLPPEAARQATEIKQRVLEHGLNERAEVPIRLGGQTFIYDLIVEPLRDASGAIIGLTGASQDITARKQAEDALRDSELFARSVLNSLTAHIAVLDAQGVIVAVNEAWKLFARENGGADADAYLGVNYLVVCEESLRRGKDETVTAALRGLRAVMKGKQNEFSLDYPCHSPGEQRWFSLRATRFPGDGPVQLVVAHENITQRKQAEELLRIQHDLALALSNASRLKEGLRLCLEAVLNISGMECGGFYLVDRTSGALDLAFHRGLSPGFVKAVAHYAADSANAKLVMAGQPVYGEYPALRFPLSEAKRREGLRAIAIVPVSHQAQVIGCLNIASHRLSDVPASGRHAIEAVVAQTGNAIGRLQAEEVLCASERKFHTLADNFPEIIARFDRQLRHIYVSPSVEQYSGLPVRAFQGKTNEELGRPPENVALWSKRLRRVFATGERESFEFEHHKAGRLLVFASLLVPEFGKDGAVESVMGVIRDITERKRAEERARMFSQEIIAAREEERKRVSSVLHHDVGSLTVGISAHLDAVEQDLRSGKPGEALQWMKRTRKLFGESVARLKKLAIELRPPELDILGLRAALRQYIAQVTERGGTRIHFRETLGRRRVSGDTATILFRVAQEALTNAITHGHATRVDVGLSASKKEVGLTIRNNGKGFNPSEQRAQATSQIGLRVMREMAVSVGGTFTIDSGRGKRTTVRMRLPIADCGLRIAD
jgi:PAS domain S-box-containing protein